MEILLLFSPPALKDFNFISKKNLDIYSNCCYILRYLIIAINRIVKFSRLTFNGFYYDNIICSIISGGLCIMNKYIEIVEDKDKEMVIHRFKNKIKYYKYIGSAFVAGDAIVIALCAVALILKKSNAMNIGIFIAVVAAFTIPFIMSSFNKVWQLGSDIESNRVQVVSGRIDKMKTEIVRKRKYNIFYIERNEIRIDDDYCDQVAANDKINISRGISSKVAISAVKLVE